MAKNPTLVKKAYKQVCSTFRLSQEVESEYASLKQQMEMSNQQNLNIPTRNAQFGFLGGSSGYDPNTLKNGKTPDYEITEGGIDYNAGLVGALAYIVSKTAPVDTNTTG